jgi:adenosylcobyric acid synthase
LLGGAISERHLFATYLHGLFDSDAFRRHFLDDLREHKGLPRLGQSARSSCLEPSLDRLSSVFRESVDLPAIYRMMGLS